MVNDHDPDESSQSGDPVGKVRIASPEPWFIREIRGNGAETVKSAPPRAVAETSFLPDPPADSEPVLQARDGIRTPISGPPPGYRQARSIGWWPFALGGALVAIIALALWLTAPSPVKEAGTIPPAAGPMPRAVAASRAAAPTRPPASAVASAPMAAAAPVAASAAVADPNAALQCARPETIARLRALVAAKARAQGGGPRSDRLAELVSLSVTGTPDAATGGNPAYRCSGWLSLAAAGVGLDEPVSVTYRVERTSDGRSLVSILEGTTPIVAAIIGAAKRVDTTAMAAVEATPARSSSHGSSTAASSPVKSSPAKSAPTRSLPAKSNVVARKPVPPETTASRRFSNPSFNCRRAGSQVNRMICASDALAALDRQAAALFVKVRRRADSRVGDALEDSRVDFLNRRQRCSNNACIARVYQERIADLQDYR